MSEELATELVLIDHRVELGAGSGFRDNTRAVLSIWEIRDHVTYIGIGEATIFVILVRSGSSLVLEYDCFSAALL